MLTVFLAERTNNSIQLKKLRLSHIDIGQVSSWKLVTHK